MWHQSFFRSKYLEHLEIFHCHICVCVYDRNKFCCLVSWDVHRNTKGSLHHSTETHLIVVFGLEKTRRNKTEREKNSCKYFFIWTIALKGRKHDPLCCTSLYSNFFCCYTTSVTNSHNLPLSFGWGFCCGFLTDNIFFPSISKKIHQCCSLQRLH